MPHPKRVQDVRSLARSYTELCVQSLAGIVQNGENEAARVAAANILLNRGWGNTAAAIDPDAGEVVVTIRQIVQRLGEPMKTIEHDSELD